MGMRNDGGRLPLESRPERLLTAPVSVGSALTVPVQPLGTDRPGAVGESVPTGWLEPVVGVDCGAGVGWAMGAPPLECVCVAWWCAVLACVLWACVPVVLVPVVLVPVVLPPFDGVPVVGLDGVPIVSVALWEPVPVEVEDFFGVV